MSNYAVADLFNVRSHNPSFFSVKESAAYNGPLLDFCIPVNLHFPPPQMVQRISERLPEMLRYMRSTLGRLPGFRQNALCRQMDQRKSLRACATLLVVQYSHRSPRLAVGRI